MTAFNSPLVPIGPGVANTETMSQLAKVELPSIQIGNAYQLKVGKTSWISYRAKLTTILMLHSNKWMQTDNIMPGELRPLVASNDYFD